jgi:hypothetical protein
MRSCTSLSLSLQESKTSLNFLREEIEIMNDRNGKIKKKDQKNHFIVIGDVDDL